MKGFLADCGMIWLFVAAIIAIPAGLGLVSAAWISLVGWGWFAAFVIVTAAALYAVFAWG